MRVCVILRKEIGLSETFLRTHLECVEGIVGEVHLGRTVPLWNGEQVLSRAVGPRLVRKLGRMVHRRDWSWETVAGFLEVFRRLRPDVVLAEYGHSGVAVMEACEIARIPLVVHFHGFDASRRRVLKRFESDYPRMFQRATAVVGVSSAMVRQLESLGCDREKLVYNPYGIDCEQFSGAKPAAADPVFVAVGRMVEKKAPHLTVAAFARAAEDCPEARLRMIGDGPLLPVCRDLAMGLGVSHAVEFLGPQPHERVAQEMRQARAFVQHSVQADDGDCEGTPLAVLEAGAMGLPVIATRHAGIPDVVLDGETGCLVDERDALGMARHMRMLAQDHAYAGELGRNAAAHIRRFFTNDQSIARLTRVLEAASKGEEIAPISRAIRAELAAGPAVTSS